METPGELVTVTPDCVCGDQVDSVLWIVETECGESGLD